MERVVSGGLDLESITDAEFSKLVGQQAIGRGEAVVMQILRYHSNPTR